MTSNFTKKDTLGIKGIAILFMVIHHCFRNDFFFNRFNINSFLLTRNQLIMFGKYSKICVGLFVFLTGYGLYKSFDYYIINHKSIKDQYLWSRNHLIKNLSNLWFICFVSYLIYAIVKKFNFSLWGNTVTKRLFSIAIDFTGFSKAFGTKTINGAWWYISAVIIYIIIFPIIYYLLKKINIFFMIILTIMILRFAFNDYLGGSSLLTFLPTLLIGMAFAKYDILKRIKKVSIETKNKYIITTIILIFANIISFVLYEKIPISYLWEYHYTVVPVLVIVFSFITILEIKGINKFLQFLGFYSLDIWLIHSSIREVLGKRVLYGANAAVFFIGVFVVSLIICIILERIKDIIGYKKYINKIIYKVR